jgi:hypothetical protein
MAEAVRHPPSRSQGHASFTSLAKLRSVHCDCIEEMKLYETNVLLWETKHVFDPQQGLQVPGALDKGLNYSPAIIKGRVHLV